MNKPDMQVQPVLLSGVVTIPANYPVTIKIYQRSAYFAGMEVGLLGAVLALFLALAVVHVVRVWG